MRYESVLGEEGLISDVFAGAWKGAIRCTIPSSFAMLEFFAPQY